MTHRILRVVAILAVVLAMLFGLVWLALDRWLESAGGRGAVERTLSSALGIPIRLGGDFGVRLLPSIGVEGTELLAGDGTPADALARGREYGLQLALAPLLRGELEIGSLRLDGGHLDLARWPEAEAGTRASGGAAPAWTVHEIAISDFAVRGLGDTEPHVEVLRITGFAPDSSSSFQLRVRELGELEGRFRWQPAQQSVELSAAWSGVLPGRLDLEARAALADQSATLSARWLAGSAAAEPVAQLALDFARGEQADRIQALHVRVGDQQARGAGCLRDGVLHLDLAADRLDFDALPEFPAPQSGGAGGASWIEDALRLRLRIGEMHSSGVRARDVELQLGPAPACTDPP